MQQRRPLLEGLGPIDTAAALIDQFNEQTQVAEQFRLTAVDFIIRDQRLDGFLRAGRKAGRSGVVLPTNPSEYRPL